jgi:hypothetical protein
MVTDTHPSLISRFPRQTRLSVGPGNSVVAHYTPPPTSSPPAGRRLKTTFNAAIPLPCWRGRGKRPQVVGMGYNHHISTTTLSSRATRLSPWRDEFVSLAERVRLPGGTSSSPWRDKFVSLAGQVQVVGKAPIQSIASRVSRITYHASRITHHVSRITFHIFTLYVITKGSSRAQTHPCHRFVCAGAV